MKSSMVGVMETADFAMDCNPEQNRDQIKKDWELLHLAVGASATQLPAGLG